MKFSKKLFAVTLLCTVALPFAHAGDDKRGVYLAASGGAVFADDMKRISGNVANGLTIGGFTNTEVTSSEDSDFGFSGAVGYRLSKGLAVEVAYVESGEAVTRHDNVPASFTIESRHVGISMLAIVQASKRISIHGRLGVAHWEMDGTLTMLGTASPTEKTSGNDLLYGVGLSYALTDGLDLTADYQRLKMKVPGGNFPIDHYLVGLRYGFY